MQQTTLDEYETDRGYQSLLDLALDMEEQRTRPIPDRERYPTWWGQMRSWGQSPQTLGELDYQRNTGYHRDDREEWTVEEHFAEIHNHTDQ